MEEDNVDVKRLSAALMHAYSSAEQLQAMLFRRLGWDLYQFVARDGLEVMLPLLIRRLDSNSQVGMLLDAAHGDRPDNPYLKPLYREYFCVADKGDPPDNLEQIVRSTNDFLDMASFWKVASEIQPRVCLIEVNGTPSGTGFLVGESKVLTNDHVIAREDDTRADGDEIVCRFDFTRPGAKTTSYSVKKDGVLDRAPWSPRDGERDPKSGLPSPDHLDFALLDLDGAPGETRGFIDMPAAPYAFRRGTPIFIVQHPSADTMKLAMDTQGIVKLNDNGTRVRYKTNTLPGASGSPCFDASWRLIALHHAGDPRWSFTGRARYNEGIPIHLIQARIKGLL